MDWPPLTSGGFHEKAMSRVRLRTPHCVGRVPERHASIRTLYGSACDPVHVRVRRGAATYGSNSLLLPAGNRFKRRFAVTRTGRKDPLLMPLCVFAMDC